MTLKAPPAALMLARPGLDEDTHHPNQGPYVGPPPKRYTSGLRDQICLLISKGQRPEAAAGACGIPRATFHQWMKRGKEGDPLLYEFYEQVEQAFDMAECAAVNAIMPANPEVPIGKEDAKWWLEKQRRAYSKRVTVEVQNELEEAIARLEANLEPALFVRVLGILTGHSMSELPAAVADAAHAAE